jgi:WD40 repeat protein
MGGRMARQHRRRGGKHLGKKLGLLLLVALVAGFWHLVPPSPRTAWQTDENTQLICFAPNGKTLVTAKHWWAGPIRLWDLDTGELRFAFAHDWSYIRQIEFSPDGSFLAAASDNDDLNVWDIATGEDQFHRKLDRGFGFRFCPDSKHILFESRGAEPAKGNLVHFWNIDTKCVDATVAGSIRETAVAQDGRSFAQWHWNQEGSAYSCVQLWKLGERPGTVALDRQFDMTFWDIAFPSNLDIFVTVSRQSLDRRGAEIAVWGASTGRKRTAATWHDPQMLVQFMFFSPDDKFVIADIRGAGRKLVKWDVRHEIKPVPTPAEWEVEHQSPDGKLLLIVQPDGAKLLDATTLVKRGTLHKEGDHLPPHFGSNFGPRLPHFTFSPNSKMVIATGLVMEPKEHPTSDWIAGWFGFSRPKRPLLFSGVPIARLYDASTANEVMAFQNCSQARFSPDGRLLATAQDDGIVRIWHAPPRKPLELVLGVPVCLWLAEVIGTCVLARRVRRQFPH